MSNDLINLNHYLGETTDLLLDTISHFANQEILPIAQQIDYQNQFPSYL